MFTGTMASKRVTVGSPGAYTEVAGGTQCRACSSTQPAERLTSLERGLVKHQCITGSADCRYSVPELCLRYREYHFM